MDHQLLLRTSLKSAQAGRYSLPPDEGLPWRIAPVVPSPLEGEGGRVRRMRGKRGRKGGAGSKAPKIVAHGNMGTQIAMSDIHATKHPLSDPKFILGPAYGRTQGVTFPLKGGRENQIA